MDKKTRLASIAALAAVVQVAAATSAFAQPSQTPPQEEEKKAAAEVPGSGQTPAGNEAGNTTPAANAPSGIPILPAVIAIGVIGAGIAALDGGDSPSAPPPPPPPPTTTTTVTTTTTSTSGTR